MNYELSNEALKIAVFCQGFTQGFYLFLPLAYGIIISMALSTEEKSALMQFKADLEQALGSQLIELKLFGSKARGDDQPDSDMDVLVIVASNDWHLRDKVYDVATDILLQMDVCISPKVISKNRFDRLCKEGTSFMHHVSKDAITI